MPDPSLPNWSRMLFWGLLASLLLHWIAFDIMRATGLPSMPARTRLQVNLRAAESSATHDAAGEAPRYTKNDVPQKTPDLKPPVPQAPGSDRAQAGYRKDGAAATEHPKAGVQPADTMLEGLRSGLPAEAMAGLRLALAQRLGAAIQIESVGLRRLLVWCDFDAAGRLLEVRSETGGLDGKVQAALRQALAQLALPTALTGRAFSLDVLLEASD